jgi:hypothetical protein
VPNTQPVIYISVVAENVSLKLGNNKFVFIITHEEVRNMDCKGVTHRESKKLKVDGACVCAIGIEE